MLQRLSLERIPLGWRLAVLVTAPLLVIGVVALVRLDSLRSDRDEAEALTTSLRHAASIEVAIAALQDERDATAQAAGIPAHLVWPAGLREELVTLRSRSDAAVSNADLDTTLPGSDAPVPVAPPAGGVVPAPQSLEELRVFVDERTLPPADAVHLYSSLIFSYLGEFNGALGAEGAGAPAEELIAYAATVSSTDAFMRARAWGATLLAAPDASPREWILLATLAQTEDFFLDRARGAKPHHGPAVDRLLDAPQSKLADQFRRDVIAGGPTGGVTPLEWRDGTQPRVDALRGSTTLIRTELVTHARDSIQAAERQFLVISALALLLIALVAFGAWRVSRSIARPLERLAVSARAAARGELAEVDAPASDDAIGEIGRAYELLDQYLHHVADSAEQIAGGDLSRRIKPRSARDRLGIALRTMTAQLASMVVDSRQRSEDLEATVDELQETASRDPLTGLLNRGRFIELVGDAVAAATSTHSRFGVLFIDLDGFKPVNDEHGHAAGDELLRQVGSRLLGVLRVDDAVARLGGDEFTVLFTNGVDAIALEAVARQVLDIVSAPYLVHGETVEVRASFGLAYFPDHGESVDALLDAADRAMYAAKAAGGNALEIAAPAGEAA